MRERQQGSQQREGIGLGEAIVAQRVLEFLQLCGGRILSRKLEQALQVVDDRIQGTVLVIGRAAKLNAGRSFVLKLLFELLHQPGFANPGLAAQQHHLACACFGLLPALAATDRVLRRGHQRRQARLHCRPQSDSARYSPHDAIHRQGSRDAFERLWPQLLTLKQARAPGDRSRH